MMQLLHENNLLSYAASYICFLSRLVPTVFFFQANFPCLPYFSSLFTHNRAIFKLFEVSRNTARDFKAT